MTRIVAALVAAASVAAVAAPAAAQTKYFAREKLTNAAAAGAKAPVVTCQTLQPLYTVEGNAPLKRAGTTNYATLAAAKAACEAQTGTAVAVCYVVDNKRITNGLTFGAYTMAEGRVAYVGSFPDDVNYAGTCTTTTK